MVNALAKRAPRSSARIDPIARLIFGLAKPVPRPDPAPQQQPTPRSLAYDAAMSDRFLRSVSLL